MESNLNVWTEDVAEHLDKEVFYHPNGKPLSRESDVNIVKKIRDILVENPDAKILDYGCGTGRLLSLLKKFNVEIKPENYVGYDPSAAMLQRAIEKFKDFEFDTRIPEKHYDLVISIDVVQHLESYEQIQEFVELLFWKGSHVIVHGWVKEVYENTITKLKGNEFHETFLDIVKLEELSEDFIGQRHIQVFKQIPYDCFILEIKPDENTDNKVIESVSIENGLEAEINLVPIPVIPPEDNKEDKENNSESEESEVDQIPSAGENV